MFLGAGKIKNNLSFARVKKVIILLIVCTVTNSYCTEIRNRKAGPGWISCRS